MDLSDRIKQLFKKREVKLVDFYTTEEGRTYVTVDMSVPEDKAFTMANAYFRNRREMIAKTYGWVKGETLYFNETPGAKKVRLYYRKRKSLGEY